MQKAKIVRNSCDSNLVLVLVIVRGWVAGDLACSSNSKTSLKVNQSELIYDPIPGNQIALS